MLDQLGPAQDRSPVGRPEVVVVGAGPVGLTLALVLGQAGRRVEVLEAEDTPSTQWRASTFHPPTLELAEDFGLIDDMLAEGLVARRYQLRDRRAGIVAEFDFSELADQTRYPFRLQLEQYKYARLLRNRLRELPSVTVRPGQRVTGHTSHGDHATVWVATASGHRAIEAPWVVGADGGTSTIRKGLDLAFDGVTYPHRYLLLGVDAPLEEYFPGLAYVNYVSDPAEHLMLLRIPDVWRVMFEVPEGASDAELLSEGSVLARLQTLLASHSRPRLRSRQLYHVHQRVAERFRVGRAFLIGDAAHINSPLGGMGLNSGIHDAYTLGSLLLSDPTEAGLQEWARMRRHVALTQVQRITHRNTRDLAERDHVARQARLDELSAIAADPTRARAWMSEASMIASARAQRLVPPHLIHPAATRLPPATNSATE